MRVFIIAGEPSGDRLGGALIDGLNDLASDAVSYDGVGGPEMIARGFESQFPMEELSVMGIAEVLPKYRALKARIRECAAAILKESPDVVVTIDSPDFCLRVARIVKAARPDLRFVHYVAPSVWAWRPKRAVKMAKVIDQVLCLLPFEPPYMEAAGMRADFVGHPVTTEPLATNDEVAAFRDRFGLNSDTPLLIVLPGSRRGEVTRLADAFGKTINQICKGRPDMRVVVPTTTAARSALKPFLRSWPGDPILIDPSDYSFEEYTSLKRAAFVAADASLAASGTVSLELAASGTPMVIAYDMNWLSRAVIARMLKIDTVTLVNLVTETRVIPEFLAADCLAEKIAPALEQVLDNPGQQLDALKQTMKRLGRGGQPPGHRAAQAILDGLVEQ